MGIQSRDYFRGGSGGFTEQWLASGCKWIIAINVVVFVLQLLLTNTRYVEIQGQVYRDTYSIAERWLQLDVPQALHGQVWRLVSYAFCHSTDSVWHILFNMLFLYWFGITIERMYGTREFVLFYLAGALVAGLAFLGLALVLHDRAPMIGASGAVMAVVMLYAIHFPRDEIYLFFVLRVQIRFLVLFYVVFDLYPVLRALGGAESYDGVAHSAHLGGLAFGYLYYRNGVRMERLLGGLSRLRWHKARWRRPGQVRLYRPPADSHVSLDSQVDDILRKIKAHGEASLTDHERDVLRRASERYKGRIEEL